MDLSQSQYTILSPVTVSGIGIHSGQSVTLTMHPAPPNTGIVFKRVDLDGAIVHARPDTLVAAQRATMLREHNVTIRTPEHLLSACAGLHITNLIVALSAEEIPIMDGSAQPFVVALQSGGITAQADERKIQNIATPLWFQDGDAQIIITPANTPKWTYALDLAHTWIGTQIVSVANDSSDYSTQIAPARTYGFMHEVQALLDRGLALGGSLDNALVIGDDAYLSPPRFPDELARHKLLDLIGDLSILGVQLNAHIIGIKSGHALHMKAVQALAKLGQSHA